jgi:hypothetical protein
MRIVLNIKRISVLINQDAITPIIRVYINTETEGLMVFVDKLKVLETKLQEKKNDLTSLLRDKWNYIKDFVHFAPAYQKIALVGYAISVTGFVFVTASEIALSSASTFVSNVRQASGLGMFLVGGSIAVAASEYSNRTSAKSENAETQH